MNVGLIDVDSHNFPNLALAKISAYHKAKGDNAEWWNGLKYYDKVYKSRVFSDTYSKDMEFCINADEVVEGGSGGAIVTEDGKEEYIKLLDPELPKEIEQMMPDYSLYNVQDQAIGFLTRGCPRGCEFCIVGCKEGRKSRKVADLGEFWTGQQRITLLDPNITAYKNCEELFQQLIDSKASIEINQGIDIRCMTDKKADMINEMDLKILHFAWDNYEFKTYDKLKKFRPLLKYDGRSLRVYVLTNFNTTHEQDLERIYKLRELDYDPYVMIYNKPKAPTKTKKMARWVNSKFIWRSCDKFENYKG